MLEIQLSSLILSSLGILSIFILIYHILFPKPYPGIPYNKASAKRITGDIPLLIPLIKASNEFSDNLFTATTRRLGTPIAQFLFPGTQKPLVIIDDPREVEDICLRRNAEFDVAPMEVEISGAVFPNSPLSMYTTPALRAHKRRWADAVSPEFLRGPVAAHVHRSALALVRLWRLRACADEGWPFRVLDDLENSTLDASLGFTVAEDGGMTRAAIARLRREINGGDDAPEEEEEPQPFGMFIKRELEYLTDTIARNTLSPSPKWAQILTTYTPRYRESKRIIRSKVGRAIGKAVERLGNYGLGSGESKARIPKTDTCMIELVLQQHVREARLAGTVENQKLIDETFVMICAGYDSLANTLTWFLKYIQAVPEVQTRLRTALQAKFLGPGMPSAQQILDADIPYLSGTCEEAVRLAGAAKAQLRQATVDTEVLGCPVPKGAQLFLNLHIDRTPNPVDESRRSSSSQAAAARFGDRIRGSSDLSSFDPGRWLVKNEKGVEVFHPQALPSTAFGGGFRGCFGRKIGEMELRIVITLLILNFEFLKLPEELRSMSAHERIFRHPDAPYVKLRCLWSGT